MNYHLIGIEGSMMKGLGALLQARGHHVDGSDLVTTGHDPANIAVTVERVVYTPAVREGSPAWPELQAARERGIDCLRLEELLAELTHGKTLLAVTGAHGKSSTTAMLAHILVESGHNPTVLLGVPSWDGKQPYRAGDDSLWVLEADDYDRKFLAYHPQIAIITTIDREHLDVYESYRAIEEAFTQFARQVKERGHLIVANDPALDPIARAATAQVVRYGSGTAYDPDGLPKLPLIGRHMYQNAMGAIAAAVAFGIERSAAIQAMTTFGGVGRRIEHVGERAGVTVYDDYGHHPTEIRATLRALKEQYPNRRLVVAFQPHQHSRAAALFDEFATSFGDADRLLLADVYAVPGRNEGVHVDSRDLVAAIERKGVDVIYAGSLETLALMLDTELEIGDVFVTMGATDITTIGRSWIADSRPKAK